MARAIVRASQGGISNSGQLSHVVACSGFEPAGPDHSQAFITNVAARAVIMIQVDDPMIGMMAAAAVPWRKRRAILCRWMGIRWLNIFTIWATSRLEAVRMC